MLRELRKKFIFLVMAATFCVFFLLLFAINAINISAQYQQIDRNLTILSENNGVFPVREMPSGSMRPPRPELPDFFRQDPEAPFTVRYCSVYLDDAMEITRISMDRIAALSREDAVAFTQEILNRGDASGKLGSYRYRLSRQETGYLLVLLDASGEDRTILSILLITSSIGLAAYLLVLLLVVLVSKKAVKPIAESYEKQKQFLADVSHELKTPLTVISADSEILAMTFGKNEWCDGIDKQTAKMRHLISRMITLTRMDGDEPDRELSEFSLSDAVFETAMAFEPLAKRQGKGFQIMIFPGIFCTGNEAELRQCVSILLDNAVKYCDEGGDIQVSLFREKRVVLEVVNTYAQAETLEYRKLFDRFYRADAARTVGNSYGLGLSIARSIVRRHKGTITAAPLDKGRILFRIVL